MNSDLDQLNLDALFAVVAGFGIFFLLIIGVAIALGHFIGKAAERKGRSYGAFFVLSILLSPLITGLVVAALPFDANDPRNPKNKK